MPSTSKLGKYYIVNGGKDFAGCSPPGDSFSTLPKPVCSPPSDNWTDMSNFQRWDIDKLDNGHYRLSIGGATTAVIDGQVCAVVQGMPPEEWVITLYNTDAAKGWTIETHDRQLGWHKADGQDRRIKLKPVERYPGCDLPAQGIAYWNIKKNLS